MLVSHLIFFKVAGQHIAPLHLTFTQADWAACSSFLSLQNKSHALTILHLCGSEIQCSLTGPPLRASHAESSASCVCGPHQGLGFSGRGTGCRQTSFPAGWRVEASVPRQQVAGALWVPASCLTAPEAVQHIDVYLRVRHCVSLTSSSVASQRKLFAFEGFISAYQKNLPILRSTDLRP